MEPAGWKIQHLPYSQHAQSPLSALLTHDRDNTCAHGVLKSATLEQHVKLLSYWQIEDVLNREVLRSQWQIDAK